MEFERRQREKMYDGRMLRLYRDRVAVRPPGGEGEKVLELEHVEHPGAACAVAFLDADRILLLRQFRYSAGGEIWEVPAGKLDGDEAPRACIERELVEETGWHPRRLEHLGTLIMTPGFSDERCSVFEARDLEKREPQTAEDEFLQVLEIPFDEAVNMVEEGVIQDAKTVAALLLAARRRGRG
ncbi:MAG: NUDIX hydrolase [Gemmatimonadetes bacterium]|nr:NUDIX hydrolase [Gemmatimonadota bacterium]